jgi:predicted phosphodiesterase
LQPPVSNVEHLRRKAAYVTAQKQQPKRACTYAADLLGIPVSTFKSWLGEQKKESHERPRRTENTQHTHGEPEIAHIAPPKPRYRIPAISRPSDDHPIIRVMAIGDPHDKPGRDKRRFTWMGRHAARTNPDYIVSIGDWASLDSLSTHELPGSANDADRPAFHEELESLEESLALFAAETWGMDARLIHTHGNHEHRATRAANRQPKLCGDLPARLDESFAQWGWRTHPFGEFVDVAGVDFVHVPLNVMGREMGGEHVERNVANKTSRSLVIGHTHRAQVCNFTKIGQHRKITVVNLGTSMPWGTIERYNGLSMTGWSWGYFDLRIRNGEILSAKHTDMIEAEEKYA